MRLSTYRLIKKIVCLTSMVPLSIWLLFPFVWMLSTSLKAKGEIYTNLSIIPLNPTLENYLFIFTDRMFSTYIINSFIIALSVSTLTIGVVAPAAYALSRFKLRGSGFYSYWLIMTQVFPLPLIVIPTYLMMQHFRLLDTHIALIITHTAFAIPFTTWMLRAYFDTVPLDIEEAAMVDGCSRVSALFRILLPISTPGVIAAFMFAFVLSWQEFIFAFTLTLHEHSRTLPVALSLLGTAHAQLKEWGWIMAGAVVATIPLVVVFIFLQRYLVKGLTATLKG